MQDGLYKNIIVGGGNSAIPFFKERILKELAQLKPSDCTPKIYDSSSEDQHPSLAAWNGLKSFAGNVKDQEADARFKESVVTAADYFEEGERIFAKFVL